MKWIRTWPDFSDELFELPRLRPYKPLNLAKVSPPSSENGNRQRVARERGQKTTSKLDLYQIL